MLTLLTRKEAERRAIAGELEALRRPESKAVPLEPRALRRQLRKYVSEWQGMTSGNVAETRGLLETVLRSRIVFRPIAGANSAPMYELTVPIQFDPLLVAAVPSLQRVESTSPRGVEEGRQWQPATFLVGIAA